MSDWCTSSIMIRVGTDSKSVEAITKLKDKIMEWVKPENSKPSSYDRYWLGNIVINSGIGDANLVSEDGISISCNGVISRMVMGQWSSTNLGIVTVTDRRPMMLIWQLLIDKYLPNAKIVFSAYNNETGLFVTNDPYYSDTYFLEKSPYGAEDDCMSDDDLINFLQDVEDSDDEDLESLLRNAPHNLRECIHEWETVSFSAMVAKEKLRKPHPSVVETNMGTMPIEDYREIMALQAEYDSYAEMRADGICLGNDYDK